jgi:hypothetical protein
MLLRQPRKSENWKSKKQKMQLLYLIKHSPHDWLNGKMSIRTGQVIGKTWTWGKLVLKCRGCKFENQKDGSVFVGGRSAKGSYVVNTTTHLSSITGVRVEAMTDPRLPRKGPGRSPGDGNFVLTELEVHAKPSMDLKNGR